MANIKFTTHLETKECTAQYEVACDVWFASGKIGPEPNREDFNVTVQCRYLGCYLNPADREDPFLLLVREDTKQPITKKLSECTLIWMD